jgi:hypothetical protein
MCVPGVTGLRLDVRETSSSRRIGNADQVLAGGTLNLATGELGLALQRLVAVRAIEFEIGCAHELQSLLSHNQPLKGR